MTKAIPLIVRGVMSGLGDFMGKNKEGEASPYDEGEAAYFLGYDLYECPYSELEDWQERRDWILGFDDAKWS